jgi:predicted nucleic acid-binding protein
MLVVADSSPLIVLIKIEHVEVLPTLFGTVVIPPEVAAELRRGNRPREVRDFIASPPSWLLQRSPAAIESIPKLHQGELAAISLARELRADLLLIDDRNGRRAAANRHIAVTGTIGVLELSAGRNLIDLRDAFERVKKTDFWVAHDLLDKRLSNFNSGPGKNRP